MKKKSKNPRIHQTTLRLSESEQLRLERAAAIDHTLPAQFVRRATMMFVEEIERSLELGRIKPSVPQEEPEEPQGTREEPEVTRIVLG